MARSSLHILATVIVAICLLRGGAPSYADGTSSRLAAYYDRKMLLCGQTAFQWHGDDYPKVVAEEVIQVGVGRDASYVLTRAGRLLTWEDEPGEAREILDQIRWFVAGRSGVFAARTDGAFVYVARPKSWFGEGDLVQPEKIGISIVAASIGDSADYFVTGDGTLHVKGLAHRGQYGDGKLEPSDAFIPVEQDVTAIRAHTGHAILLKQDGTVMGTGGNIYGPLGRHGIGDKAISWGAIFHEADAIATGSSHSLALKPDGTLWHWRREIGLDPEKVLENVVAAAADRNGSVALLKDGSLWQWDRGEQPKAHFRCP